MRDILYILYILINHGYNFPEIPHAWECYWIHRAVCESLYFLYFMDHDIALHLVTVSIIPRVVDNMPVAWCTKNELDSTAKDICTTSFPVGCFIDKNGKTLSRCNPVQVSPPHCLNLALHFNLIINRVFIDFLSKLHAIFKFSA